MGVDIGTTSVKALAVDEKGEVVARSRVAHRVLAAEPDQLRHDARRAWRAGPRKAYADLSAELDATGNGEIAGRGRRRHGPFPHRGQPRRRADAAGAALRRLRGSAGCPSTGAVDEADPGPGMPDAEGFLRWAHALAPEAKGYWPCQAVATHALSGVPAIDTGVTASMGALHAGGKWNAEMLDAHRECCRRSFPTSSRCAPPAGTLPGTDTVFTGGSIDAMCDQVVAGADSPGDVHVIFGATLIVWVVADNWIQVPGLISYPHTTPGPFRHRRAEQRRCACSWTGPAPCSAVPPVPDRAVRSWTPGWGRPHRVPIWLPYVRGERTPFDDHTLRSNLYGLDIASGPEALERAAFEASGFVIRRIIDRAGVRARRIVASGGGSQRHRVDGRRGRRHRSARGRADAFPTAPPAGPPSSPAWRPDWRPRSTTRRAGPAWGGGSSPTRSGPRATRSRYERFCELGTGA